MTEESSRDLSPALQRLRAEGALTQLLEGTGRMAQLGSENGRLMLDWVQAVPRLVEHPELLEGIESEAQDILDRGITDIIWSGMGGSVMAVRVLTDLGFCGEDSALRIHPLDSTDPAAINAVLEEIAARRQVDLSSHPDPRSLLSNVMMIAVSMGMTSEEPITQLQWFTGLLDQAGLDAARQALVMTLPGSYLDDIARECGIPRRPLQPDGGNGTPGRFSAPGTRVFLLPAALALLQTGAAPGALRTVLSRAGTLVALNGGEHGRDDSARLAAQLANASVNGACLLLRRPQRDAEAIAPWVEQLLEESLGKGGKGVAVFHGQPVVEIDGHIGASGVTRWPRIELSGPEDRLMGPLAGAGSTRAEDRLALLATAFVWWERITALYGYLEDIVFVGQPAVENYKARARELREHDDPLQVALDTGTALPYGNATLVVPAGRSPSTSAEDAFVHLLTETMPLTYLDLTVNGELPTDGRPAVEDALHRLGNEQLGVPVKLRRAPAAYHSTEQMQMDGIPGLVSLRAVSTRHQPVLLGEYDDRFLKAQSVATWQAMNEQGRPCALLIVDGANDALGPVLTSFLADITARMDVGDLSRRTD